MQKNIPGLLVGLALLLSACASPTPTATQPPAPTAVADLPSPTATAVPPSATPSAVPPTDTPAPTATATATHTATPAPQPISAANAAQLARVGVMTLPRQPILLTDAQLSGIVGGYTADSQHLIVRTDAGVDILAAATLELEQHYPGLRLVNGLSDGRFAALQAGALVFVDPLSGERETIATEASFAGQFAVSPTGAQVASVVDDRTLRVYTLAGGAPLDIALKNGERPAGLWFTGDGGTLVLDFVSRAASSRFEVYAADTAAKLYEYPTYRPPQFSTDGRYFTVFSMNGFVVAETATNTVLNVYNPGHIIERGCDFNAKTCVDEGVGLAGVFMIGRPETAITILVQTRSEGKPGNTVEEQNWQVIYSNQSAYMTDLLTGVQAFVFSGPPIESLHSGLGAPDGSTFVLIQNNATLSLHSLANGEKLAETNRYAVGGPAQLSPDGAQVGWANTQGVAVYDWQTAALVFEQGQPLPVASSAVLTFLPDGRMLVASAPSGGAGLDVWNLASGQSERTVPGLADCQADPVGLYVLCTVTSSGARRILALDNPDRIVFSTNDPNLTALSPTGDSYTTCTLGGSSITYKHYEAGNATIAQPCQPMVYRPDGLALILQSGVVIDLPSGDAAALTLAADANGQAFSSAAPAVFSGPDFIVLDNRVFDAASGALLAELPWSGATGYTLSAAGLTLTVLTPLGLEQWQVLP